MFHWMMTTLQRSLQAQKMRNFSRRVSFGDLVTDRWENARQYGFGEGSSCYDNVLIIGDVKVGKHTWIGPNVILDGSGGIEIGDYCSINAGVQIYSHDSVKWCLTDGQAPYDKLPVHIGSGVFIGANSIISKGVSIGDHVVVGSLSFVNNNVPSDCKVYGQPARVCGQAMIDPQ